MKVTGSYTHKYNPRPRLSANQIGEYLWANASNRRQILTDAKFPPSMITTRYETARRALTAHLLGKAGSGGVLAKTLALLERQAQEQSSSTWSRTNYALCTKAIESYLEHEPKLGLGSYSFKAPNIGSARIKISGVSVSVALDLLAERNNSQGKKSVGGAVLVFCKSGGPEGNLPKRCDATALLIREFLDVHIQDGEVDPAMCMAVDVFSGKIYRAKRQQKMLWKNIQSSCEEIALRWPSIRPPENYNGPTATAA